MSERAKEFQAKDDQEKERGFRVAMNVLERAGDRWASHRLRRAMRWVAPSDFESPIEACLGLALIAEFGVFSGLNIDYGVGWEVGTDEVIDKTVLISPQAVIERYRVDIVIGAKYLNVGPKYVAIECDGHDFHEKTKAQAARDKARDRSIQAKGIPVFRFTGSEIWRDANACAIEVFEFLSRQFQGIKYMREGK